MTRKLLLLNVVLLALVALAAWQLRREWEAARARETAVLSRTVKPVAPPPLGAHTPPPPVAATAYIEIAQKALPFKDRNPNVIIEAAPPPPPKPMPPLPVFLGVMNLGDGPSAVLAEKPGAINKEYKAGDKVGEFTLVAISRQEVTLEWEGKTVMRRMEIQAPPPEAAPAATERAAPAKAAAPVVQRQMGPGVEIGRGLRACAANDSTPAGAVVDGLKKVVSASPFGEVCRWEPVK